MYRYFGCIDGEEACMVSILTLFRPGSTAQRSSAQVGRHERLLHPKWWQQRRWLQLLPELVRPALVQVSHSRRTRLQVIIFMLSSQRLMSIFISLAGN